LTRYSKNILFCLLFIHFSVFSQSTISNKSGERFSSFNHWLQSYPDHLVSGFEHAFLEGVNPYKLIAGASAIMILSNLDQDIKNKANKNPFFSAGLSRQADNFGKTFGWGYFAGVGFITVESIISPKRNSEYFSKLELVLESIAVTQIITQTLKMSISRERPNFSDDHSFPSGHTSSVFALATSMNGIYGWKVGVPAFLCATIVGAQRISSNSHYFSDVLTGAMIGIMVGSGFSEIHNEENLNSGLNSDGNKKSVQTGIWIDRNTSTVGAQLKLNF
jgi:hypothetical protein